MRLVEVVERLSEFDSNKTIYAATPWTEWSEVIVAFEPMSGGLPPDAAERGMTYFLEVDIAINFLEDWIESVKQRPTAQEICQRLISYAVNDA